MKGKGFARRVTLATLPKFAPFLSFTSESDSGSKPPTDPELRRAESLFKGERLTSRVPFTRVVVASRPSPATDEESPAGVLPGASATLRGLLDNANQFFLCNMDRRYSKAVNGVYELEELMWSTGYAAAWEKFTYPEHMKRVKEHDAIFMYANGLGVIGIGRARSACDIAIPHTSSGRVDYGHDTPEWKVPVEWLYWDRNQPCPWLLQRYPTFLDVSKDSYSDLRDGIRRHLFGE